SLHPLARSQGLHLNFAPRHFHRHHFGRHQNRQRNRFFAPHPQLGHSVFFFGRPGFHHGFFFDHRIGGGFSPSPVLIWHSGFPGTFTMPREEITGEKPIITMMLHNRRHFELSAEQVHELEEIRYTYQREAIRYGADLRIAELEVQRLSHADPVDLERVRAELEHVERLKVDLRLARLEAIEKGKALLSPGQRAKLSSLLGEREHPPVHKQPRSEPSQDHPQTRVD
ncbi:MAG TPA: periplasmic heavy metal sensor, partial [Candidatus Binatia bacterium]|nr:periplasmic heavy metal sensor [Candidatus Binatia bacterium]